jgi:DNA-binding NtrC family response regulator
MFVLAAYAQHRGSAAAERILILDAAAASGNVLSGLLAQAGYAADTCSTDDGAFAVLSKGRHGVLIIQQYQSLTAGSALARKVQAEHADVSVILLTADRALDIAVTAFQAGVFDFMTKSFEPSTLPDHLLDTLRRVVETAHDIASSALPAVASSVRDPVQDVLIGNCQLLERAREQVRAALADGSPVLISGEAGTEKLLVARLLHDASERRGSPFVAVNGPRVHDLGPLPSSIEAQPGTLFVADVSALDVDSQLALAKRFSSFAAPADEREPRLLGGLNQPPSPGWEGSVLCGFFLDAGARQVSLPPLRERGRDVLILAEHFAEQARLARSDASLHITSTASDALSRYAWPGNVDELRFAIQHAASLCSDSTIRVADLPPGVSLSLTGATDESGRGLRVQSLEDMEISYISRVLDAVGGNKAFAARLLGVDRTTLYRKLQRQEQSSSAPSEIPPGPGARK